MSGPGTFAEIAYATGDWVELGNGPMQLQTTTTNVLIAISDGAPSGFVGFSISPTKVLSYSGTSGVWVALRPGSVAAGRGGAVRYAWLNQILIPATGSLHLVTRTGLLAH